MPTNTYLVFFLTATCFVGIQIGIVGEMKGNFSFVNQGIETKQSILNVKVYF